MQDASSGLRHGDRLDSWKDIAAYLRRDVRTVQLWEKNERLPVQRHAHRKRSTVYAYKTELDVWLNSRRASLSEETPAPRRPQGWLLTLAGILLLAGAAISFRFVSSPGAPTALVPAPLTTFRGMEVNPALSPDGSHGPLPGMGRSRTISIFSSSRYLPESPCG